MIFSGSSKESDFIEMLNSIKEAQNHFGFYFHSKYSRKGCVWLTFRRWSMHVRWYSYIGSTQIKSVLKQNDYFQLNAAVVNEYHLQCQRTKSPRLESEKESSLSNVDIVSPSQPFNLTSANLSTTLSKGPNTQLNWNPQMNYTTSFIKTGVSPTCFLCYRGQRVEELINQLWEGRTHPRLKLFQDTRSP